MATTREQCPAAAGGSRPGWPSWWPRSWRSWLDVAGWTVVGGSAAVLLAWRTGMSRPVVVLGVVGLLPYVLVPVWPVAVAAAVARRWWLAAAAGVCALGSLLAVAPALGSDDVPAWAETAPRVRVAVGNLQVDNDEIVGAATALLSQPVDVVVLVEVGWAVLPALRTPEMFERFPYRLDNKRRGGDGAFVLSRFPIVTRALARYGDQLVPEIVVRLDDGRLLRVVAVHPLRPAGGESTTTWEAYLSDLAGVVDRDDIPTAYVGDFNATRWHQPFARLLRQGLTDAHEARGRGLSRSWPAGRRPLLRLDHALLTSGVAALAIDDVTLPGSDHRGFVVDLAVSQSR